MLYKKELKPYLLGFFTAFLSAIVAMFGIYYTAKLQTRQAIVERESGCRKEAYIGFLNRIARKTDLTMSELLNTGTLEKKVITDSDIQDLENRFAKLPKHNDIQAVYIKLSSDINLLRICASKEVNQRAEALLNILIGDFSEVDVSHYPKEFREYYNQWTNFQKNSLEYGFESLISDEQRASLVLVSEVLHQLVSDINFELQDNI